MVKDPEPPWHKIVVRFRQPRTASAVWQLANTLIPYALLWYAMYLTLSVSFWLTVPLAIVAAGLLVRLFIIFHDCTHGSFLKSRRANDIIGFCVGMLTFTPYQYWRWQHTNHHATSGDLDRRGTGDVWTMTVDEYQSASYWKRLSYRLARNPVVLFLIAPLFVFVIGQRFCPASVRRRERLSVQRTNLAILALATALSALCGIKTYLVIQLGVMMMAGAAGMWLFYIQHQFDGVYWARSDSWDYTSAGLRGSSYYKLPAILRWLSGNIGFHHIHHLCPRIPNYNLKRCHDAGACFRAVKPVTLSSSLKALSFRLWDERRKRLVGYQECGD
jgi:omega-6 fatty acid desaturase (delta-12 desaturase)